MMQAHHVQEDHIPVDWLLKQSQPWVRYWTLRDLQRHPADSAEVKAAHAEVLAHADIQRLLGELAGWPGPELTRHDDDTHPLHKLAVLAEFGLTAEDELLKPIIERILTHQADDGAFTVRLKLRDQYEGGSPQIRTGWMMCDAPVPLYALLAFGLREEPRVKQALEHLVGLVQQNGWPCATADDVADWPDRHFLDPCPYATLVALKAISRVPSLRSSMIALAGVEMLLRQWEVRDTQTHYLFANDGDFKKLKYPLIWYDILHVVDVLSRFPASRRDPRFVSMLNEVLARADDEGCFHVDTVYPAWQGWDFAAEGTVSPTITLTIWRAWRRAHPGSSI